MHRGVEKAAKEATIHNFIVNNNFYYAKLTKNFYDDGYELSAGQWQKLSIAKVFYSDLPILLFDEPTSNIDKDSESKMYDHLGSIKNYKIIIVITHNIATSLHADRKIDLCNEVLQNDERWKSK